MLERCFKDRSLQTIRYVNLSTRVYKWKPGLRDSLSYRPLSDMSWEPGP